MANIREISQSITTLTQLSIASSNSMITLENLRLGKNESPHPVWASSYRDYEDYYKSVYQEGFDHLINETRKKHNGKFTALIIGDNLNPLESVQTEGDFVIALALQDLRSSTQKEEDERKGFYLIPYSIGSPVEAMRRVRSTLGDLYKKNKIDEPKVNIVLGKLVGGLMTLPVTSELATIISIELGERIDLSENEIAPYRTLIGREVWNTTSSKYTTILVDTPPFTSEIIKDWINRNKARLGDVEHRLIDEEDPMSDSLLKIVRTPNSVKNFPA